MKALTVKQPWAWAILHGGKDIENRTQLWTYRGPLLIHAGAVTSTRGEHDPRIAKALAASSKWAHRLEVGALVGLVDLVDVHPDTGCCRPWGESSYAEAGGRVRRTITHLVLENPRSFAPPIPCRGALGLWTPPADVLAEVEV